MNQLISARARWGGLLTRQSRSPSPCRPGLTLPIFHKISIKIHIFNTGCFKTIQDSLRRHKMAHHIPQEAPGKPQEAPWRPLGCPARTPPRLKNDAPVEAGAKFLIFDAKGLEDGLRRLKIAQGGLRGAFLGAREAPGRPPGGPQGPPGRARGALPGAQESVFFVW